MQAARGNMGLGVVMALLLLSGCEGRKSDKAPRATFAEIKALTRKSCLCRMAGRDAAAVERKLEKLTTGLRKEGYGSASTPLGSDGYCYPELGEQACAGEYEVVTTGPQDFVCTSEQADELDHVWNATGLDADRRSTRADAALLRRLWEMRHELAAKIPQSSCN